MHQSNIALLRKTVLEVQHIELSVREGEPRELRIHALGTVPSPGWSEPQLIPYIYVQPPPDGIYDFLFTALAPLDDGGFGGSAQKTIQVTYVLSPLVEDLKGVRIHASSNSQVALLERGGSGAKSVCVKGTLTDEGVECQTLRGDDGKLYTLVGDLGGFGVGDDVYVAGTVAEISFCQQGTTINVTWIGETAPRCQAKAA